MENMLHNKESGFSFLTFFQQNIKKPSTQYTLSLYIIIF